jgi:hypothetical protein
MPFTPRFRRRARAVVVAGYTPDEGEWQCGEHTFELTMNAQPSPLTGDYDVMWKFFVVVSWWCTLTRAGCCCTSQHVQVHLPFVSHIARVRARLVSDDALASTPACCARFGSPYLR